MRVVSGRGGFRGRSDRRRDSNRFIEGPETTPNTAAPRRWMMNSKVLDESIAESLQTLDLMCFSEQYYFLVALISFGMLLVTMGVTTFINTNYNFFGDPVMPVIVVIGVPRSRRASILGLLGSG